MYMPEIKLIKMLLKIKSFKANHICMGDSNLYSSIRGSHNTKNNGNNIKEIITELYCV